MGLEIWGRGENKLVWSPSFSAPCSCVLWRHWGSSKNNTSHLNDAVTGTMSKYCIICWRGLIRSHWSLVLSLFLLLSAHVLLLSLSSLPHILRIIPSPPPNPPVCFKVTPAMKQIRQQHNYEYICILLLIRTFVIAAANLFCSDNFRS